MSFSFVSDGIVIWVHTEVGDGPARIVFEEQQQPVPDMEPSEVADA